MTTIGFLGAGQLGEPMVRRLLGAGKDVLVFARRDEVRSRLKHEGAKLAASVPDLAARSDILISCLFSDAQLRETGLGPDGFIAHLQHDAVFVSHTTGTLATLRELSASSPAPPAIIDAPVSGTADDIAEGKLTVLAGGDADALERVRPILAAYADPIIATGALGTALDIKLVNNMLFAANAQLVAAAAAAGEKLNVAPDMLLRALSVCSGWSNAAAHAQRVGGVQAFVSRAAPFLRKDVAAAISSAEQAGADLGFLRLVVENGPLPLTTEN
ncbi:6-phosphogluconate dehydrogenase [Mycobacterium heckeshornense]|uniref:6-phosphogluconate dehydrogenase n=2 Tax=Mycobacterium TaxID=1763 RepID=A0A7R7TSL4_9MYCO|nr:NAD(P)-dependent oxidoreductase [Mycobacterium heckeshornense]BCO34327.1 6-phosphogluconate dehydrogenase [Mycobacterium heckeshornense]BCQ07464.1 6-phosphogluconate dehydrogenase [Mycobacterium heckeshornense]